MKDEILIFTDGSSRGNPGPGGWGAVIIEGTNLEEIGGGEAKTTNNRMELMAALEGLKKTSKNSKVKIYTDSGYLINGITKWIFAWVSNNWKTKANADVLNKDIWQKLHEEVKNHTVTWQQVKGHAGIAGNHRADEIATAAADGADINLYKGSRINYALQIEAPTEEQLNIKSDKERRSAKAYSYVSLVDGVLKRDTNWTDCEARVKGQKGVKFRKAISKEDEADILESWGL
jgi:ribonuclease HI